jgi:TonB-like protein
MRFFGLWLAVLLSIVDLTPLRSADLPRFRPALPGTGPTALINQIDRQDLLKKGQKVGAVMFCCYIARSGNIMWSKTYRPVPGSDLLQGELERCLEKVKFFPAVYEHQLVDALYFGTVSFAVVEGKPRLRIFSNQETAELKEENDFIGPQPIVGVGSQFTGLHAPGGTPIALTGLAYLALKIDAAGNLEKLEIIGDKPPSIGFAEAAAQDFNGAKFVPAFRNGDPVESNITLPVYYDYQKPSG